MPRRPPATRRPRATPSPRPTARDTARDRSTRPALLAVASAGVLLTATGASLLPPPGPTPAEAAAAATEEAVAAVWRAGATADTGAAAELLSDRGGDAVSRSDDRTTAAPEAPADPVAQARRQVERLALQQGADDADLDQALAADGTSPTDARDAVAVAQQERAAAAAAAALAAAQADPRAVAAPLVAERGWDAQQFQCLDRLWTRESLWTWSADNPTSSAYGIPQALPGAKMASHGADWETNPVTQIAWGLDYVADRYGVPCAAWRHSQARGWY